MDITMGWMLAALIIFSIVAYAAFAFLLPEWVGIQGKLARDIEANQRSKTSTPADSQSTLEKTLNSKPSKDEP